MERRDFLTASCAAGIGAFAGGTAEAAQERTRGGRSGRTRRDYIELRTYHIDTEKQKKGLDAFLADAAIPALNRLEIDPVGVFYPMEDLGPVYVMLRHTSLYTFASLTRRLIADEEFVKAGAAFLDAPATDPAYKRVESSLLMAFEGMPKVEVPTKKDSRIFQLRRYESPSVKTGQKKIEMFNVGELGVFREVGLNPVFFGEAIAGELMPNLTYMLGFDDEAARKAAWGKFGGHPEWKRLKGMPEYADKKILSNITNIPLKPASYSQV